MEDSSYSYEAGFDNVTIQQRVSAFIAGNKPVVNSNSKEPRKPVQRSTTHFTDTLKPYVCF